MSGQWIMYDNGGWDFKLDNDRMGMTAYAKFISDVDNLKHRIIEAYDLVGTPVFVELSYCLVTTDLVVTSER